MTQKEASEKMPRLDKKKKKFPPWLPCAAVPTID